MIPGINPDYWKAIKQAEKTQIVEDDIPPVEVSSISRAGRELSWSITAVRW
jgi:hypothetical protein